MNTREVRKQKQFPVEVINGLEVKMCKNCLIQKEVKEFKTNGYLRSGKRAYKPHCKYCFNLIARNSRIIKGEDYKKDQEYKKKYRETNRSKFSEASKIYYKNLSTEKKQAIIQNNRVNRNKARIEELNLKAKRARLIK